MSNVSAIEPTTFKFETKFKSDVKLRSVPLGKTFPLIYQSFGASIFLTSEMLGTPA
jgi:hypothetical protein